MKDRKRAELLTDFDPPPTHAAQVGSSTEVVGLSVRVMGAGMPLADYRQGVDAVFESIGRWALRDRRRRLAALEVEDDDDLDRLPVDDAESLRHGRRRISYAS